MKVYGQMLISKVSFNMGGENKTIIGPTKSVFQGLFKRLYEYLSYQHNQGSKPI